MISSWFQKTFLRRPSPTPAAARQPARATLPVSRVKNIYPPDDPGLPLRDAEYLLNGNSQILGRLKLHAATSEAHFDQRFIKPLERLAEHISALPATSSGLFSGEGGLFCASIELAFLSFQASDGRIFTGAESVERRHKLEPRWRYFCFAAALLYPIGKPLGRMIVTNARGEAWQKHHQSLVEWTRASDTDRIYVSWPEDKAEQGQIQIGPSPYTASILHKILGPDNLAWLEDGSTHLTRDLFEVVSGADTSAKIARDVIATMWQKVRTREEARMPENYGRLTIGTHLTPYLVGAMRAMVDAGTWVPNGLPFIVDATGLYLVWPQAGHDIVKQGKVDGHEGWPSSPSVLADLLKAAGIFDTARGDDSGQIEVVDFEGNLHQAFKLKNPFAVMESYDPADYKKSPPKTLVAVLAADPIAAVERRVAQAAQSQTPNAEGTGAAPQSSGKGTSIDQESGEIFNHEPSASSAAVPHLAKRVEDDARIVAQGSSHQDAVALSGTAEASDSKPGNRNATRGPSASATPVPDGTPEDQRKVKEAPEIKFSDLVPEEIRREMKTPLSVELLGKVIKTWRERGEDSTTMRMTDNGAAISFELLSSMIRNIPDWVNEIAFAGLVYTAPATPGLKIMKVAIPEGSSKPREAIVISRYGCKKLGL